MVDAGAAARREATQPAGRRGSARALAAGVRAVPATTDRRGRRDTRRAEHVVACRGTARDARANTRASAAASARAAETQPRLALRGLSNSRGERRRGRAGGTAVRPVATGTTVPATFADVTRPPAATTVHSRRDARPISMPWSTT